jgi:hypothetical protein
VAVNTDPRVSGGTSSGRRVTVSDLPGGVAAGISLKSFAPRSR